MKGIRRILAGLIAFVAIVAAMPQADAKTVTTEERKQAVAMMSSMLPMDIVDGMTWNKCSLSPSGDVLILNIKLNPRSMGTTLAEAKAELDGYTNSDVKMMLGDEFSEMLEMFGCDAQIVFTFPDGTTKKFKIRH